MTQEITNKKWYDNKIIVAILCIIFFPVGLYALWMSNTISKGWKIGITVIIAVIVIIAVSNNNKEGSSNIKTSSEKTTSSKQTASTSEQKNSSSEQTKSEEKKSDEKTNVSVGQVLKTKYFEVTVNEAARKKSVKTGNQFTDLKAEKGIRYLVLNTTFKNIDEESRMLIDGDVIINYNGKDYTYDKSETIFADGWGLLLDQINPLTSKTTNLVYKIPEEITGRAYYRPGRSGKDDLIFLGNLK